MAAKITEFYLKATEYQKTTYYQPLLDPIYGYVGIIALLISTGLNAIQYYRSPKNNLLSYRKHNSSRNRTKQELRKLHIAPIKKLLRLFILNNFPKGEMPKHANIKK